MRIMLALMSAVSLAACGQLHEESGAPVSAAVTPEPVIAAERAFAADALTMGVKASFLKHSADDAIVFQPEPVNAHEAISAWPDDDGTTIVWWPVWAGIAQSGDLGFTTGPAKYGEAPPQSYYFTVWAKQSDGSWKWIYDGGPGALGEVPFTQDSPVDHLPLATAQSDTPEAAMAEVAAVEADLAAAALGDAKSAYVSYLSESARLTGAGGHPVADREAQTAELERRTGAMTLAHLGGRASAAGDFVFSYGDAAWSREGQPRNGHYVRIWQKSPAGWRIAAETLIAAPPAPPPDDPAQED